MRRQRPASASRHGATGGLGEPRSELLVDVGRSAQEFLGLRVLAGGVESGAQIIVDLGLIGGELEVEVLGRGMAWLDAGTHGALLQAANFIKAVEQRQGLKIGCIEEVAYRMGFITADQLEELAAAFGESGYASYLMAALREE